MKRAIAITILGVFLFFACGVAIAGQGQGKQLSWGPPDHARNDNWNQNNVKTNYGNLKGYQESNGTWVWKGVPFAKPPVGEIRWTAPEDPEPWVGVRDAAEPCRECTQELTSRTWIRPGGIVGSEN